TAQDGRHNAPPSGVGDLTEFQAAVPFQPDPAFQETCSLHAQVEDHRGGRPGKCEDEPVRSGYDRLGLRKDRFDLLPFEVPAVNPEPDAPCHARTEADDKILRRGGADEPLELDAELRTRGRGFAERP